MQCKGFIRFNKDIKGVNKALNIQTEKQNKLIFIE